MNPSVLIVEDEPQVLRLLQAAVERGGYRAATASSGREAMHIMANAIPQAALVDLGLPDRDGMDLVRQLSDKGVAVIVVSARDTTAQKVAALDLGAADYIVKPFDTDELLARLRAALRARSREPAKGGLIVLGELSINLDARMVLRGTKEVRLSPKEYALLELLARNAGRVLTHAQLLKDIWGPAHQSDVEYLRVAVRAIRQKLESDPTRPTLIRNEPGVGYRLIAPERGVEREMQG
jgi:two-component system, OmpR family, KDP operon response regulator KdpE